MRFSELQRDPLGRPVEPSQAEQPPKQPPASPPQQAQRTNPVRKFIAPVANYTVSRGIRSGHAGVDLVVPPNTPVLAPEDGVILDEGAWLRAGEMIKLQGATGTHKLMHLAKDSIRVKKGQRVRVGEQIALSGTTGRTTGPHVHWELWINNQPQDPLKYIS